VSACIGRRNSGCSRTPLNDALHSLWKPGAVPSFGTRELWWFDSNVSGENGGRLLSVMNTGCGRAVLPIVSYFGYNDTIAVATTSGNALR